MDLSQLLQTGVATEINISVGTSFLAMLMSALTAYGLRLLYIAYGRSMNNRAYFGNIFVLLAVTTCAVIIIVKYSLALSLGLVGALSIVRFRAAIKEPEELVFLFLTIALGLAFGSNQFLIAFVLFGLTSIIIVLSDYFVTQNNSSDAAGIVAVIEGDGDKIRNFRRNGLVELLSDQRGVLIKEISYDNVGGRIVVRSAYMDDKIELFFGGLEDAASEHKFTIQILSDVSVPF